MSKQLGWASSLDNLLSTGVHKAKTKFNECVRLVKKCRKPGRRGKNWNQLHDCAGRGILKQVLVFRVHEAGHGDIDWTSTDGIHRLLHQALLRPDRRFHFQVRVRDGRISMCG